MAVVVTVAVTAVTTKVTNFRRLLRQKKRGAPGGKAAGGCSTNGLSRDAVALLVDAVLCGVEELGTLTLKLAQRLRRCNIRRNDDIGASECHCCPWQSPLADKGRASWFWSAKETRRTGETW